MHIENHIVNQKKIAELQSNEIIIKSIEDGIDLIGNMYYQEFDTVIIHEKNIIPDFFDLKTKLAGEILQKFSNYRIRLIIVGDISKYSSKSLQDFIYESNNGKHINFINSVKDALFLLQKS